MDKEDVYFGSNLQNHINKKVVEWKNAVLFPNDYIKDSTGNLVKVGCYCLSENDDSWYFYENNDLFWSRSELPSKKGQQYKKDYNILVFDEKKANKTFFSSLDLTPYLEKGINKGDFNAQHYGHSEHNFLSRIKSLEKFYNINFKKFVLLIVSTNQICDRCFSSLNKSLSNDFLLDKYAFSYFYNEEKMEKILTDKTIDNTIVIPQKMIIASAFISPVSSNEINTLYFIKPSN
jgi:hypothetical protein